MQYTQCSDEQVIKAIRSGDHDAMDYLLSKYRGMVRKESRRYFLIGADEEDLIQEGMIGLFKAIRDFDVAKKTDFALFANVCITRQLITAVTTSNRQKHTVLNTSVSLSSPVGAENSGITMQEMLEVDQYDPDTYDPEQVMLSNERVDEIWKRIEKILSPLEKKVLDYYLEGYSYEWIGEKLGKSKKSIDNAVQRIRAKLSKHRL